MPSTFNESQLQLTLQTFERDPRLNIREAAQLYNIPRTTLSIRLNDISIYADIIPNLRKLTTLKEKVVIRKVFNLDSRGFLPRIYDVKDIANRLLAIYDTMY